MGRIVKIFGPPGTGKTTFLLNTVDDEVDAGTLPGLVAFITFSKDAIRDARRRAAQSFQNSSEGDGLQFFRTFHSLAWLLLGLGNPKAISVTPEQRTKFCDHFGIGYDEAYDSSSMEDDHGDERLPFGNAVFQTDAWLTNNLLPIQAWRSAPQNFEGPPSDLPHYVERWRAYKLKIGRLDFADVLERCRVERPLLPVRVLVVDEFQDLNPLQFALYEQWAAQADRVYIAGDDDQTIYKFHGASETMFLGARADETRVLPVTHRLHRDVLAYSQSIIRKVRTRKQKSIVTCICQDCKAARRESEDLRRVHSLERPTVDAILRQVDPEDTMILARTNAQVKSIRAMLVQAGVPFHGMRGPDSPRALWTRPMILAKTFHDLRREPSARVPYVVANQIVGELDVFVPATGRGYVERAHRDAFARLPARIGASWPMSALGEDFREWTFGMIRRYLRRVPSEAELGRAFGLDAARSEVLLTHVRRAPDWPISTNGGIRVGTIHSSKGQQASVVVLMADVSRRLLGRVQSGQSDHDAEHRLFYVGATRALQRLVVLQPFKAMAHFPLPQAVSA